MRGAWSATLLTVLATTTAAISTYLEPEAMEAIEALKSRILADLGMKHVPDIRTANISAANRRRVERLYWRNVQLTEDEDLEILTFKQQGSQGSGMLLFRPDLTTDSTIRWAKLRFPKNTSLVSPFYKDVSAKVRQWTKDPSQDLIFSCTGKHCYNAQLNVRTTGRQKRADQTVCGKECCRRSLRISFADIGWNWIERPREFEAFYCKGRCDAEGNFASTHAYFQSILKLKGRRVSRPCCAPSKLRALNLVYYNDENPPALVSTKQKGMIVKDCACA